MMNRYRDLLIACNVQASSGPTDTEGLYYMLDKPSNSSTNDPALSRNVKKMMEKFENGMDADLFRSGVMRNGTGSKCKSKVVLFCHDACGVNSRTCCCPCVTLVNFLCVVEYCFEP